MLCPRSIRAYFWFKNKITYIKENKMNNFVCVLCGYVYRPKFGDEENGIEPGTDFDDLHEDWTCPLCGAGKEDFEPTDIDDEE